VLNIATSVRTLPVTCVSRPGAPVTGTTPIPGANVCLCIQYITWRFIIRPSYRAVVRIHVYLWPTESSYFLWFLFASTIQQHSESVDTASLNIIGILCSYVSQSVLRCLHNLQLCKTNTYTCTPLTLHSRFLLETTSCRWASKDVQRLL